MISKPTTSEKIKSIEDTVPALAEYLIGIGKASSLDALTRDEVCGMIRVCQEGVQKSLQTQLARDFDDIIPF